MLLENALLTARTLCHVESVDLARQNPGIVLEKPNRMNSRIVPTTNVVGVSSTLITSPAASRMFDDASRLAFDTDALITTGSC